VGQFHVKKVECLKEEKSFLDKINRINRIISGCPAVRDIIEIL